MAFGKLFVISAPSGSGKTSLVKKLLAQCGNQYSLQQVITYTTRPARQGEIDGQHYHFISIDEFKKKIEQNFFIEWSTWYDHYYGSPLLTLKKVQEGHSFIMVLDRLGAKEVLQAYPQAILIWIEPPSLKELKLRLKNRGDGQSSIMSRLRKAEIEIQQEKKEQLYKYHIVNDNFELALRELKAILTKELAA